MTPYCNRAIVFKYMDERAVRLGATRAADWLADVAKPVDFTQLTGRLNKLRFNLQKVIVDALKKTKKLARS